MGLYAGAHEAVDGLVKVVNVRVVGMKCSPLFIDKDTVTVPTYNGDVNAGEEARSVVDDTYATFRSTTVPPASNRAIMLLFEFEGSKFTNALPEKVTVLPELLTIVGAMELNDGLL